MADSAAMLSLQPPGMTCRLCAESGLCKVLDSASRAAISCCMSKERADLRRRCSRRPPSNGGDADGVAVRRKCKVCEVSQWQPGLSNVRFSGGTNFLHRIAWVRGNLLSKILVDRPAFVYSLKQFWGQLATRYLLFSVGK